VMATVMMQHPDLAGDYDPREIAMCCTMMSAFCLAVNSRVRCKERSRTHLTASTKWRQLESEVNSYLRYPPKTLLRRDQKMKDLLTGYSEATSFSPSVPHWKLPRCLAWLMEKCPSCLKCKTRQDPQQLTQMKTETEDDDAIEEDVPDNQRQEFNEADCDMLLIRYAQAEFISQACDKLAESKYTTSSVIGSCAGAAAIMSLASQAMSFSPTAPSWCLVVGGLSNVCLAGLSIAEGANGLDDQSKILQYCRNDFGAMAFKIYQALFCQPHVRASKLATKLNEEAEMLINKWVGHETLMMVFELETEAHRGADGVTALYKEAAQTFRSALSYQPPSEAHLSFGPSVPPFPFVENPSDVLSIGASNAEDEWSVDVAQPGVAMESNVLAVDEHGIMHMQGLQRNRQ